MNLTETSASPTSGNYLSNTAKPEYIICAAIHFDDGVEREQQPINIPSGFVISGRRHHNCFATAFLLHGNNSYLKFEKTQGFLTSKDRFVNREEAAIIALREGQISKPTTTLFSEDLY